MDSIAKILADLAQLHSDGHLTDAEFAAAKEEALSRGTSRPGPSDVEGTGIPVRSAASEPSDERTLPWNWKRIPDFRSRTRRSEWWAVWAIGWAVLLVGFVVAGLLTPDNPAVLVWLSMAVFLGLYWGASVNRLHDLGMNGWWMLAMLVPLLGLWVFTLIAFKNGDPEPNRWGHPIGSAVPSRQPTATVVPNEEPVTESYANEPATGVTELAVSDDARSRSRQLAAVAIIAFVVAAALGVYLLTTDEDGGSSEPGSATTSSVVAQGTVPADRATSTTTTTTSTLSVVEMKGFDAQVRDFLIQADRLEADGRYVQASDGGNWFLWVDGYEDLAEQYIDLAEQWDRSYADRVNDAEEGFGQVVSHALIRRSDGYRLVYEASTSEAIAQDIDSWLWQSGVEAHVEASALFDEVWRQTPDQWQAGVGVAGSALEVIEGAEIVRPDPVPVFEFVTGDCYERPNAGDAVRTVDRADCVAGVDEVVWIEDMEPLFEGYPGEDGVQVFAEEFCIERVDGRFPFSGAFDGRTVWWAPNAQLWADGYTTVACVLEL